MRVFGKSSTDNSKYIVEVDLRELQICQIHLRNLNKNKGLNSTRVEELFNKDGTARDRAVDHFLQNVFGHPRQDLKPSQSCEILQTADNILDAYNSCKISASALNVLMRRVIENDEEKQNR